MRLAYAKRPFAVISRFIPNLTPSQAHLRRGGGVIWHRIHLEAHVIPAQAGIHCAGRWKRSADRLDSRLRGNDGTREPPCLSNDATTGLEIEDIEQSRTVARHCTLKGMPVPRLRDGLYDPRAAGFSAIC